MNADDETVSVSNEKTESEAAETSASTDGVHFCSHAAHIRPASIASSLGRISKPEAFSNAEKVLLNSETHLVEVIVNLELYFQKKAPCWICLVCGHICSGKDPESTESRSHFHAKHSIGLKVSDAVVWCVSLMHLCATCGHSTRSLLWLFLFSFH